MSYLKHVTDEDAYKSNIEWSEYALRIVGYDFE